MDNYFEQKYTYNQISFRYAKGKSLEIGNEIHSYHEILYYIDGDATFLSEGFKEKLNSETLLIIPKEVYHKFSIKNQKEYRRFVISFPDIDILYNLLTDMSQIKIIKNININIRHILDRMCSVICSEKTGGSEIFCYGAFLSLISELSFDSQNAVLPAPRSQEQLIAKCIEYIEEHYTEPIYVEDIAKKMYVSASTLFQCFKKELGISLHKYISEKRIIHAQKLILKGENPTKIYKECGFNDYSSFYKAYKKMFSVFPSADKKSIVISK